MFDFLSGIGDFFGGLASALAADLVAVAQWLYGLIVYVAQVIATWVQTLAEWVAEGLTAAARFFSHLWNTFFKGLWTRLLTILKQSQIWDDLRHGHILLFLADLQRLLNQLYASFVRPLLILLQRVRTFLQILRALHIGFATALDNWIAQLEGRIAQSFLTLRNYVNAIVDVLNLITDGRQLIAKPVTVASARRIAAAVSVVLTGRPLGYWAPSPKGSGAGYQAPWAFGTTRPASSYLGSDDGLENFAPLTPGITPDNSIVDTIAPLDYFVLSSYPPARCSSVFTCLQRAVVTVTVTHV